MGVEKTSAATTDDNDRRRRLEAFRRRLAAREAVAEGGATPSDSAQRQAAPPKRTPGTATTASAAQQRLWLQHESDPTGAALNVGTAFDLHGQLDVSALTAAAHTVATHHEILRTRYLLTTEGELRAVPDLPAALPLEVRDAPAPTDESHQDTDSALDAALREELRTPFDLETDHPVRLTLLRHGEDHHTLQLVAHHIAWDDACWPIFFEDLAAAYQGRTPTPASCHADAALPQDQETAQALPALREHWTTVLHSAAGASQLGVDPAADTGRTEEAEAFELALEADESAATEQLARTCATTVFGVLLTAFAAGLRRHTGGKQHVIGSPVLLRDGAAAARTLGYFGNVLLLPVPTDPRAGLRELTSSTGRLVAQALEHQDLPYDEAVRLLGAAGTERPVELSFAVEDAGLPLHLPGIEATPRTVRTGIVQAPLSVLARREADGRWVLRFEYAVAAFAPARIRSLADSVRRVLRAGLSAPEVSLGALRLTTEEEDARLLLFGSTPSFVGPSRGVLESVEGQAAARPDAVALRSLQGRLTYRELNNRANAVARLLAARGLGSEDLVACAHERSFEAVVVALGVLKSGAALLPLDVAHPPERLSYLLDDARPRLLLTSPRTDPLVPAADVPRTVTGTQDWQDALTPLTGQGDLTDRDRVRPLRPDNLAYVIHTSGSTGRPKGVSTTHAAFGAHLEWLISHFLAGHPNQEAVRWLQLASPAFDVSLGEIFGPLCAGGEVLVPTADVTKDLDALFAELVALDATVVHAVPSFLHYLVNAAPEVELPALRWLPVGGEALPGDLADRVRERFGGDGQVSLGNFYGPTETTQAVTGHRVDRPQGEGTVPIGRPKRGNTALVLDADLGPVPPGEVGELYLEGSSLARGYLGRPALTAERFVASPLTPGQRLYRTGDLARFSAEGDLEFVGRTDDQVKIRGFRVEPGEIEAVLRADDRVGQAVVVPREQEGSGTVLVAWVTPAGDESSAELDVSALRERLTTVLPAHMLPGAFVVLDELPLTPAGKTDRHALPDAPLRETRAFRDPAPGLEREIARLFAQLLGTESESAGEAGSVGDAESVGDPGSRVPQVDGRRVGADTSFFELGGHSLLLTRLLARIRRDHGVDLAVREAFAGATPAQLADLVRESRESGRTEVARPALTARTRPATVPMSPAQQRIWFVGRVEEDGTTYNIPIVLELTGPLEVEKLRLALGDVVRRHESLRTVFPDEDGVGHQLVLDDYEMALPVTEPDPEKLDAALTAAAEHPFDLARERPLRAELFRREDQSHVLSLLLHHIVCDEVSAGLLIDDLTHAYQARVAGEVTDDVAALPSLPVQYADYALWQREWLAGDQGATDAAGTAPTAEAGLATRLADYWRTALAELPQDTAVLLDFPRPAQPDSAGGVVPFTYDADVRHGVERLAERTGTTPFMVLQAAVATLLCKLGAGEDVPLGTPIVNRPEAVDEVIGLFVNLLVIRNDLSGDPTLEEIVRRSGERAVDAYGHADLPFERVVEAVGAERSLSVNPLFQVLVQLRDEEDLTAQTAGLSWRSRTQYTATAKYDLSVNFEPSSRTGGWAGELIYRRDLYEERTVEQLVDRLGLVLRAMGEHPEQQLHRLDLVSREERERILTEWSHGPRAVPERAETLPELVQRSRTLLTEPGGGERIAVDCAGTTLDYATLHERSDRLARLLLERGAGPERFVAIAVPRTLDMVVALLAVVKTGAAYLPLDLRLPAERLAFMIDDAAPVTVVTTQDAPVELPDASGTPLLVLDDPQVVAELAAQPAAPLPEEVSRRARGENLSYFLYTSGSTGVPKGVIGTQRAYAARLTWQPVRYPISTPDVRLCQGWLSFHDGGCEILAGLLAGAKLILADESEARDVGSLVRLIENNPIGQVTAVPTAINALIGVSPEAVRSVPRWISSGEPMTEVLLERLRATAPDSEIFNNYGATELSGGVVRGPLHSAGLHLGTAVDGARVLVLDQHLNLCPPGVPGEVYASGHQLARGYWRRAGLTASRFLPDPYADEPGSLLYRTGDRARWSADGRLLFGGRTDHQVKVRGIRIELGEIEAVLRQAPEVALAAARTHELNDSTSIAGYITLRDPAADHEEVLASVRRHLARELPAYLHPSVLTVLQTMPLTGSGKLNRPALPLPDTRTSGERQPPRTETERTLATLLGEVLNAEDVGREDGFFALGGDSIISVQLASRARARGLPLTAQMVFENPTVAELAAACDRASEERRRTEAASQDAPPVPQRPAGGASGLDKETLQALLGSWQKD